MNKKLLYKILAVFIIQSILISKSDANETPTTSPDLKMINCHNWDRKIVQVTVAESLNINHEYIRPSDRHRILSEICISKLFQNLGSFSRLISISDTFGQKIWSPIVTNSDSIKMRKRAEFLRLKRWESFFEQKDQYNFDIVIPGLIYRSRHLGSKGLEWLNKLFNLNQLSNINSLASIHVYGYGGGKFKHKLGSLILPEYFNLNYNLEEFKYCKLNQIEFLHTYHTDPYKIVYFDGVNPSQIPESPHHGDIYRKATTDIYLTPESIKLLDIDLNHSAVPGDTLNFLETLQNLIKSPWPLLIHCKGGKHKTGMISMIFQYLYHSNLDKSYKVDEKTFESSEIYLSYINHAGCEPIKKNTDFVKSFLSGKLFNQQPDLEKLWIEIQSEFSKKFLIEYNAFIVKEAEILMDSLAGEPQNARTCE